MVTSRTAIGVDIGGTRIRVGVVTAGGQVMARAESALPRDGDPERLQSEVAQLAAHVRAQANASPAAVGVALPGVWDRATGVMQRAINLPLLEGTELFGLFERALGCRVLLESDVNAAIWAQWHSMTPRPSRLVYLSIGTGVGGSVLLDGQIVRHTRGGAGHFGFLVVDTSPDAPVGRNGVRGCLSAIAAGPALHLAATGKPDLDAIGNEPLPDGVVRRAAEALAVACVQLAHIYVPDVILFGGGVIDHHPELVERSRAAFRGYESSLIPPHLQIARAPLSTHEAGVIGVALLALG